MKKNFLGTIFLLSVTILFSQNPNLYLQTSEINDLMVNYDADKGSIRRFYSAGNGSGFAFAASNYNLPERRWRLQELIQDYQSRLSKIDFDKMSIHGKADYILFNQHLENEKHDILQEEQTFSKIKKYFPFIEKISTIQKPRIRGMSVNGEEVAKQLEDLNKDIITAIKRIKKTDTEDKELTDYAQATTGAYRDVLKDYFNFYNDYDPLFSWWVPKSYTATDSLLKIYGNTLKAMGVEKSPQKDDGSGIIGHPVGRDELIRLLRAEFIPYNPEELIDIANKEFAWCDTEMLKASRELGFGDDWKSALEKVKNSYVPEGKQPEAMYDLYKQSVDFLKKNDLVTIPPIAEETWRMIMMTPERQRVNPFFTGGEVLSISYPASTMTYEEKMMSMRGNNPYFSRSTVHHELIAGHHLQMFMNNRNKTYRNFDTPFWIEGNALYWELLLWDMKFPRNASDRVGMLFWRMHRCARIIFSLKYHLGNWTPQQCIDFLVDRVGHERANAEGEVRRSFATSYKPLYQLAYMMGGLQFMALKRELVDTKKMTLKQYHDAILKENSMPIEILRAILTNQKLSRDFSTNWRFYKG